jgi:CheY-like chemotaxis protein
VKAAAPPSHEPETNLPVDRERLVIVADADEARGKATAEAIRGWGLSSHVVLDGVEAMLAIQRMLPRAVVLDAGLPKMFGFQVCEVVKRNESLRETTVVLIGAIHDQDRYRRDPSDLYGADVYIEQPDLPDGLLPILREAGLPVQQREANLTDASPPSPGPAPVVAPSSSPDVAPRPVVEEPGSAPATEAAPAVSSASEVDDDPALAEERERARRLARIAVSEMLLYQPEKFEQAIVDGNLEQVLGLEIQEAQALLQQRISEEVRSEADFVMDELQRVAAERS